jgi:hypothetical protein
MENIMYKLLVVSICILLHGCAGPSSENFMMPSGLKGAKIDCVSNTAECFTEASKVCNGSTYQVVDSWSNAGGSLKDWIPGPFTWYHMQIACGPSDGAMPSFPFRGQRYVPPKGPTITECNNTGGTSVTCQTY